MPGTDQRPLKVFLSYASQDRPVVRELSRRLVGEGWIDTWLDEKSLLPGQDWRLKIEEAVEDSDIVIIFLSCNSVSKEGYVQKELRYAREIALEKPQETIFLIPFRLDECEVPRGLRFYQWVDYFGEKKEESYSALIESLKLRHVQRLKLEELELARKEKLEREREAAQKLAREQVAREKAEKDAAEKVQLEAEELARQKAAKERAEREAAEKLAQEKAEKDAVEKAHKEPEDQAREKAAKKKAEQEAAKKKAAREQATREKAKRATEEKARLETEELKRQKAAQERKERETSKKIEKEIEEPIVLNPKANNQIAYWIIGFVVLVFGIILFSTVNAPSITPTLTPAKTQKTDNTLVPTITIPLAETKTATPTISVVPTQSERDTFLFDLVFVSKEGENVNLYRLLTNGEKRNLTVNSQFSLIANPSFSPDGKFVAFETDEGIIRVDVNTSLSTVISSFGGKPRWSPVRNQIVFVSDETKFEAEKPCMSGYEWYSKMDIYNAYENSCISSPRGPILSNQQIYVIDLENNEVTGGDKPLIAFRGIDLPAWDYTGAELAYVKRQNVDFLCVVQVGCQQIKDFLESFDWSPLTEDIVYSARWKGSSNIYLLNTDDFSQKELTTGTFRNYSPIWSHSGKQIAFVSDRDGNDEIYIIDIANLKFENITQNTSDDFSPVWSPDDKKIIFVSDRTRNLDIFSVDINTRETINVTNTPDDEFYPIVSANE